MAALRIAAGYRPARCFAGVRARRSLIMQSPLAHSHRKPRRVPGLWVSIVLALAVHAGVGFALFVDADRQRNQDPRMAADTAAQRTDSTARMGAAPAPASPGEASPAPGLAPGPAPVEPPPLARRLPRAPVEATVRPSFDCQLAQSLTEDLICSDPELARLDRDLARLYARARFVTRDPVGFREQTHDEWRRREETCSDPDCLREWYARRRKQLNEVIAQSGR